MAHRGMVDDEPVSERTALPPRPVVGILHPGTMGAALGSALKKVAGAVIWAAAGRSVATSKRAELADLVGVPDLDELARRSDVVISICPPHAARDVAEQVAAALAGRAHSPLYVDANAVSPATVRGIGALLGAGSVVDASVIGPPAWEPGHTVLWLSGAQAQVVAGLFDGSPFEARVLDAGLGTASALKACFGLHSKAATAIRLEMVAAARGYGVEDALREELVRNGVDVTAVLDDATRRAGTRAWRWAAEMDEAADMVAALGLPDGFSRAAAEVYRRLSAGDPRLF